MSALVCSMVCLTVPAVAIQPFTIVSTDVTYDEVNNLRRYDMTVQVGENPMNRFIAHQIVRVNDWHIPLPAKGPIVLAPSGGSTFEIYGVGGDGASLRDALALEGYDVYGYTPRPASLEAGYCNENDCSVMGTWDMEAYVNDAETVALFAGILSGGKRPVIGGFSLGAMIATAAVNDHPFMYAGALLWEGTLVQPDPNAQAAFSGVCDALNQALGAGVVYDDEINTFTQYTVFLGLGDPTGQSPFEPNFTNEMWMNFLTTTPFDPPDGEAPGYTYLAGDFTTGWTYADPNRVLEVANQLITYEPLALMRDYKCAYAGDDEFVDDLDRFRGPVLSIQSGVGFGVANEGTLALMTNAQITRVVEPTFGHLDWVAAGDADTAGAITDWLDTEVAPNWCN